MNNTSSPEERRQLGAVGTAAGLGCSIVVSVMLCIGGGVALDAWFDSSPLFTLIGVALGLIASGYQLYELALVGRTDRKPGPVSRQIARIPAPRRPERPHDERGSQRER